MEGLCGGKILGAKRKRIGSDKRREKTRRNCVVNIIGPNLMEFGQFVDDVSGMSKIYLFGMEMGFVELKKVRGFCWLSICMESTKCPPFILYVSIWSLSSFFFKYLPAVG